MNYINRTDKILQFIKDKVEEKLEVSDISDRSRAQEKVYARFMFYDLAKQHLKISTTRIGKFVNRDHSTVCYGKNKISDLVEFNKDLDYLLDIKNDISKRIHNYKNNFSDIEYVYDIEIINRRVSYLENIVQKMLDDSKQNK